MKNKLRISIVLLFFGMHIYADEKSSFAVPLRVEPAAVYTKIRIDGQAAENRESMYTKEKKQGNIEGELKFLQYFSVKVGTTKSQWEKSGSKTLTQLDRLNVGLKFAKEHQLSFGSIVWVVV